MNQTLKIGLVSISDRASQGVYEDKGLPALRDWLKRTVTTPLEFEARLIADEQDEIQSTLIDLVDYQGCQLVLTTGGTGPAPRDVTRKPPWRWPTGDARFWRANAPDQPGLCADGDFVAPGGGVIRKQALILNLPGQPKAIAETLEGLRDADGQVKVPGIFAAVPYCLDLIGAPWIDTDPAVVKAFRPKSAQRPA